MDQEQIIICVVICAVCVGFGLAARLLSPSSRRAVGRVAQTGIRLRMWPIIRDPLKPLRDYDRSLEHQAQKLANRIKRLLGRLRRRGYVSEADAASYSAAAGAAIERVCALEGDARELVGTPGA